ncbi:unnamed protein product, partial [Notodromas monacha]
SPLASRIHCPSPLGDPCSSCYSSDERSIGGGKPSPQGPVCSSTPTPQHQQQHSSSSTVSSPYGPTTGLSTPLSGYWQTKNGGSASGGRTSPGDLGYHTLVTRGGGGGGGAGALSASAGPPVDVGLPLGLNLTHGLSSNVQQNNSPSCSPWATETTCVRNMPPPVVPRGSNYPITLTMNMMDPPVGAHRPAPPTPPGLEISAFDTLSPSPRGRRPITTTTTPGGGIVTSGGGGIGMFGKSSTSKRLHHRSGKLSHFDRLADDLILKIFSYLSTQELCSCARVSRRFYHLAWDPKLWTTISLNAETANPDRALKVVAVRSALITRSGSCFGFRSPRNEGDIPRLATTRFGFPTGPEKASHVLAA